MSLPTVIIVTGTDTGVGKTVTTAAIAAALAAGGRRVSVYKPCQSGASAGDSDCAEVLRLAGPMHASAGVVLGAPLAPAAAAALEGAPLPPVSVHAERIRALARHVDHVLVEGSGGLLVGLDEAGRTLADLAGLLDSQAGCVVVSRPGLGTLNHTALTLEGLHRRGLRVLGVVVGTWPSAPGPAEVHNRRSFEDDPVPLLGVLPAEAATLPPAVFRQRAGGWLPGLPA